jgi:hypothetical protein
VKIKSSGIKWTLIILGLGGVIYIGTLLYPYYAFVVTIPGEVKEEIREKECIGTITAVTRTQPCFSKMTVKQVSNSVDLTVCTCGQTSDFWNFTKAGDRIEKKKGQMTVTIIKLTSEEKKEFEYPYCLH